MTSERVTPPQGAHRLNKGLGRPVDVKTTVHEELCIAFVGDPGKSKVPLGHLATEHTRPQNACRIFHGHSAHGFDIFGFSPEQVSKMCLRMATEPQR